MIKYKIQSIEFKTTSTGKKKADTTLIDFEGNEVNKVTIWEDYPNFSSLRVGTELLGDVVVKKSGIYTNKTLYPERTTGFGSKKFDGTLNRGGKKFDDSIRLAQERKNDSIAYFNSINCAIAYVSAFKGEFVIVGEKDAYNTILEVRDRFLEEWHKYESDPTKGRNPF